MKKATLIIGLAVAISACKSVEVSRNLASGTVGCPPQEIAIADEDVDNGVHTFRATCKGREYYCTYMYPNPISCKEATPPAAK